MARLLLYSPIVVMLGFGLWAHAGARGYEHGKADASRALSSYGMVIVAADGACRVIERPGELTKVERPIASAHTTMLVRLRP